MNGSTPPPPPPGHSADSARPSSGLAIAALVLGILSILLSWVLVGGLLALVGIGLAATALRRKPPRPATAQWGLVLSIFGLLGGIGFGVLYLYGLPKLAADLKRSQGISEFTEWVGVEAPSFQLTTLDGQTVQLKDWRGKRVVLDFWATWCPPCRKEIPHFVKLHNETSRDQLMILGISDEDEATLKSFVKRQKVSYPIASSKGVRLPEPYALIRAIPTTFFIDRKGIIQKVVVGYHDFEDLKRLALGPDYAGELKPPPNSARSQ